MDKVWVVSRGEYSDRRIEAIFSSEDKAKAYKAQSDLVESYDEGDIQEWALDGGKENWVARDAWVAVITVDTGAVECDGRCRRRVLAPLNCRGFAGYDFDDGGVSLEGFLEGRRLVYTSTTSLEHAKKCVVEMRQKALALRAERDLESAE